MVGSGVDELATSVQRAVLGAALALLALVGVGLARQLPEGNLLVGLVGLLLAGGAGLWILYLLREGLRERSS